MSVDDAYHIKALEQALAALEGIPCLSRAARSLRHRSEELNKELQASVLASIPAFSQSQNPRILPELAGHAERHTQEVLRLLDGGELSDFRYVVEHAERRAEQRFPLEAVLHAYRCGHKVFSRWVRDAAVSAAETSSDGQQAVSAVADFTIEYTDAISTIAAGAYLARTCLLADVAGDQRAALLNVLLEGHDESDRRVERILREAGYLDRRQSYCVALARSVDPGEMLNPSRARRLVDAIDEALRRSSARRVVDLRDNKVTMVFADVRRQSGWSAPRAKLAAQIAKALGAVGNTVLIGISNDAPSTAQVPQAHREAQLALEHASLARRVVQLSALPVRRILVHLGGERLRGVLPAWAGEFWAADAKLKGTLVATLKAYADADMNVLQAADVLAVHPNTVYARFQRISALTELDARNYHALTELLLVAEVSGASV